MLDFLKQLDQELLLTLNGIHNPFWDRFMWIVSEKLTWVPMYATIIYILCRNFNIRLTFFSIIAIVLVITYCDQMCATYIRPFVERLRPSNLENPLSEFIHIVNGYRGGRNGFPSCHAANSFGLAFIVMLLFKQKFLTIFVLLWASLNSYSRIHLGVHYPGDILAGMLVGLSGALIIYYSYRYALRIPKFATLLQYDGTDKQLLEHPKDIKYTSSFIYVGVATLVIIAIYSLFTIYSK